MTNNYWIAKEKKKRKKKLETRWKFGICSLAKLERMLAFPVLGRE